MTSFTKALYQRDPDAAEAFYRQQQFEHRLTYGKNVTLACFTLAAHAEGYGHRNGLAAPSFGKRAMPPVLPAYECWMPDERGFGAPPIKPKAVIRAADSFQARQEYATYHGIKVTDVAARKMGS